MAKWVNCKECGHEFSSALSKCPECGKRRINFKTAISAVIGTLFCTVIVVGLVISFSDKGSDNFEDNFSTVSSQKEDSKKDKKPLNSEKTELESNVSVESNQESSSKEEKLIENQEESKIESENEEVSEQKEENYPIGTIIKNDLVYTTVPKYYLEYLYNAFGIELAGMSFEEFAYELDDTDKAYGFSRVIKNTNGNATTVLSWSKLTEMKVKMLTEALKYIKDTENQKYITKIGKTEALDKFEIILNTEELTSEQEAEIMIFGLYFLEYQYYTKDSGNDCEIVLVYPDSNKKTLNFPEIIKQ